MGQRLLLSLPAVAAAIVAWAALAGPGERVRYAQVLGGPTPSVSSLLVRCVELERDGRARPSAGHALRVIVESSRARSTLSGVTDATGHLELRLDLDSPVESPALRVESAATSALLAEGRPALSPEGWRAAARRRGGWLPGRARGALEVRAAAASGTFAVPFESALVVQVLEPSAVAAAGAAPDALPDAPARPLAGARVEVELAGASLLRPAPLTDDAGLSRVALRPEEHAVSARVVAQAGARRGEWYGVLPVTPGALVARRRGDALEVRSPIARARAFAAIVSESARIAGAVVPLATEADGSASGGVVLDAALLRRIERAPTWVVVSSEFDKRSAGVVGWPLSPAGFDPAAPPRTFDVADAVLLDGRAGAIHAAERERAGRRRVAAGALLAVGLLLTLTFWRTVRRPGAAAAASGGERDAGAPDDLGSGPLAAAPLARGGWVVFVALACIALGLGGLAWFGFGR